MRIATGEYVQFVDSDDYVDPRYTELLLRATQESGCPCAICGYIEHHANTQEEHSPSLHPTTISAHDCVESVITRANNKQAKINYNVWNRIYLRTLFTYNAIWFPEGRVYEDVCVMVPLTYHSGVITLIPSILYHKNDWLNIISYTISVYKIKEIVHAYAMLLSSIESIYPDLLPLAFRYYEMILIISLLRLTNVSDRRSSALFRQFRTEALARKKDLELPRDIQFALALRAITLAPHTTTVMYRFWRKLRRV